MSVSARRRYRDAEDAARGMRDGNGMAGESVGEGKEEASVSIGVVGLRG